MNSDDEQGTKTADPMDSGYGPTAPLDTAELDSTHSLSEPPTEPKKAPEPHHTSTTFDSGLGLTDSFTGLSIRNDLSKETPVQETDFRDDVQRYFLQNYEDGDTELHIAIVSELPEAVIALLQMCPHPALLDIFNDSRQTPLHLAVLTRQNQMARRLLLAGAKLNSRDANGNTPLHLACAAGDVECLQALATPIKSNPIAASRACSLPHVLDQVNHDGQTCVHLAVLGGHLDILHHLVWYGANINAFEHKSGRTALHLAIENRNVEILSYLLKCPLVTRDARTYSGHTALQLGEGALREQLLAAGYVQKDDESDLSDEYDEYSDDDDIDIDEVQYNRSNYFNPSIRNTGAINVA